MRFCPFCSAENVDDAALCVSCARRMPPPPLRRQGPQSPIAGSVASGSGQTAMGMQPGERAPVTPPPVRRESASPLPREMSGTARRDGSPLPLPPVNRSRPATAHPRPGALSPSASQAPRANPLPSPSETSDGPSPGPPSDQLILPPPTRPVVPANTGTTPPPVEPLPEVPDAGIVAAVRYTILFVRGRWQRKLAIRFYRDRIRDDTGTLDGVLYELGTAVRGLGIENRATSAEMHAIDEAERRRLSLGGETVDLQKRLGEENLRFTVLEAEREAKVGEAETALNSAEAELEAIEAQRRGLRDKRKTIERTLKAYLKAAEDREGDAGKLPIGDERTAMRRTAEDHRREAAAIDPDRQDLERKLSGLDKPHSQATAKVESLKAELVAARRGLQDAREGHRHRLSELDAEQGRKGKELSQAAAEIHQRLVTLGTIVNLNRVERPELDSLYSRIDTLREAIGERSRVVDRLTAERDSYHRGMLIRGAATMGGGLIVILSIIIVVIATL